jgi:hypothetical protein
MIQRDKGGMSMSTEQRFADVVTSEEQFRAVIGHPSHRVLKKEISFLDASCRAFIAKSPFVFVASCDAEGRMDISPKGDPSGFVYIIDDRTLAIPDRPGNRRADTFQNLLQNPHVGLLFLIPGKSETLRVSGRAIIVRDSALLERMTVDGKIPGLALVVTVEQAFLHCPKCMIRSALWDQKSWPDESGLPTLAESMVVAGKLEETVEEMQALIDKDARTRLY